MSKARLYQQVSGYSIMADIMGFAAQEGVCYSSPLRQDRQPSFNIYRNQYGEWRFKDFGRPDVRGTAIDLYALKHGLTFSQALQELGAYYSHHRPRFVEPADGLQGRGRLAFDDTFDFAAYDEQTLAYWAIYGITRSTLERYGVRVVRWWRRNGWLRYSYDADDPCFAIVHPSGRFKLYWPLRGSDGQRFMSSLRAADLWGYHRLFRGPTVVVTKSFKDVLVLREAGVPAVTVISETISALPRACVAALKKVYEHVVLLFDNDAPGLAAAQRLSALHDVPALIMPSTLGKDPADVVALLGPGAGHAVIRRILERVPALPDHDSLAADARAPVA